MEVPGQTMTPTEAAAERRRNRPRPPLRVGRISFDPMALKDAQAARRILQGEVDIDEKDGIYVPARAPLTYALVHFVRRDDAPRQPWTPSPTHTVWTYSAMVAALPLRQKAQLYSSVHANLSGLDLPDEEWGRRGRFWRRWNRTGWEPRMKNVETQDFETPLEWEKRLERDPLNRFRLFAGILAEQAVALFASPTVYPEWVNCAAGSPSALVAPDFLLHPEAPPPPPPSSSEEEDSDVVIVEDVVPTPPPSPPPAAAAARTDLVEPLNYFLPRTDVIRPRYAPFPGEGSVAWSKRVHRMPQAVRAEFFTLFYDRLQKLDASAEEWGPMHQHWRLWQRTGWQPKDGEDASQWATRLLNSDERNCICFFFGAHADMAELFHNSPEKYPEWVCYIHAHEIEATMRSQVKAEVRARQEALRVAEDGKRRTKKKEAKFKRAG
jgi:hypothetical protein